MAEKLKDGATSSTRASCILSLALVYQLILNILLLCTILETLRLRSLVKELRSSEEGFPIVQLQSNFLQKYPKPNQTKGPPDNRRKREVLGGNKWPGHYGPPGVDGKDGDPGTQGIRGPPGPDASKIRDVQDHVNEIIKKFIAREKMKLTGTVNEIPSVSGGTYIRWGRTTCAKSSLDVYKGTMGGSYFSDGGGDNPQCFPENPKYLTTGTGRGLTNIHGIEYQTRKGILKQKLTDKNAPCVVCLTKERTTVVMIPGNVRCPNDSWTEEYIGYLMAEKYSHKRMKFICLDKDPEIIPGYDNNSNGGLLYHTSISCRTFGSCPPYKDRAELACIVCSR